MSHRSCAACDANEIDRELFRVITRAESLYDGVKADKRGHDLLVSLQKLRAARIGIRAFMHADDRAHTQ